MLSDSVRVGTDLENCAASDIEGLLRSDEDSLAGRDGQAGTDGPKKRTSRWLAGTLERTVADGIYWLGSIKRGQPVVLTSRNSGVRGGNCKGFKKALSKL